MCRGIGFGQCRELEQEAAEAAVLKEWSAKEIAVSASEKEYISLSANKTSGAGGHLVRRQLRQLE